jgi:hypothetical protein
MRRYIKFAVTGDQFELLKMGAKAVGVPPSVHARYLALNSGHLSTVADQVVALSADVAELRRAVATLANPDTGALVDKATLKRGLQMLLDAIRVEFKNAAT